MNPSVDVLESAVPDESVVPVPRRNPRGLRIPFRDRTWMPFHTVRSVCPIRPPSAEQIRQFLIKLWQTDPGHPLLCRLDERRGRRYPVAAEELAGYLSAVIIEVRDVDAAELAERMQAVPLGSLPFMIGISDRAAAMRSAHAIGDTATANPWFFGLLKADDADHGLALITGHGSSRFPVASAVINHFGRDPRRALRAIRRALPLGPAKINSASGSRRGGPRQQPLGRAGAANLVTATAATEVESALRQWRSDNAPKASMAAVWMATSIRALRDNGIDTGAGVFTMMNCRRYLPGHATVQGNFAVGPYLTPADPRDPASLGTELANAAADGVPLVLLSALTARSILRRGSAAKSKTVGPGSAPKINLSYFGTIAADDITWSGTDHDQVQYVVAAEPAGPQSITYVLARSPYGMHLSATAHRDFVDVSALQAALEQVARDPVGLLS